MSGISPAPATEASAGTLAHYESRAEAFREGNLGIMDYYRMKNLQADTDMREEIAHGGEETPSPSKK